MEQSKNHNHSGKSLLCAFLLLITAVIWGSAFVSQSVGAEYVGAFTFLAGRSWIAVVVLLPVTLFLYQRDRENQQREHTETKELRIRKMLPGGLICGTALFVAAYAQQVGIAYTTTAKASFITTLYVILVPVISIFLGRVPGIKIWFCVVLGVIGLYFLCIHGGIDEVNKGDVIVMLCALLFSIQILAVDHYVKAINGVVLSFMMTLTEAVLSTICVLILEHPTVYAMKMALPALLYAGVLSSGVGYTLQVVAQGGLNPTVASLIMCLESVFGALGGWLILNQKLSSIELFGCCLMFAAVVISQLPIEALFISDSSR